MQKVGTSRTLRGFTIVELLIVIVIIGILAALVIVAYNGIQQRALISRQNSDMNQLIKAIMVARENTGKTLYGISNNGWTMGGCSSPPYGSNPDGIEPAQLPKSHACWTQYIATINAIAAAADTNLDRLKAGDSRGNPYAIDENEGYGAPPSCTKDVIAAYSGTGNALRSGSQLNLSNFRSDC